MNLYDLPPNKAMYRAIPIFSLSHLLQVSERFGCNTDDFTLHANILVRWDEDYDPRVFGLIDQEWPPGHARPLSVSEREGGLSVLWPDGPAAMAGAWGHTEYSPPCGDNWTAYHFFIEGDHVHELDTDAAFNPHRFAEFDEEPTVLA